MIVLAVIPSFFALLLWRCLALRGFEAREAWLAAQVILGVLIAFSTEVLSVFQQVSFIPLLSFWLALIYAAGFWLSRCQGAFNLRMPTVALSWTEKAMLGASALIVLVVGFIALYAPPNTWDSMTYHMSRVEHWRQNNGVMNYPTNIIRQLVYFPYAEYAILHLQVLGGSDRFANSVQFGAMIGSALGVSLISRELGSSRFYQIVSALLVLTLPMGILQGSSTQNDHVVAFWSVCAAFFVLKVAKEKGWLWVFLAGASVGLTIFTKGIGLLLTVPFIAGSLCLPFEARRKLVLVMASLAAVVILAGPFYIRLTALDKDPAAAMRLGGNASMERIGVIETASNILRNGSTQLALPWKEWNKVIQDAVLKAHQSMGIDILEPRTTAGGPYKLWYYLDEDYMPDPLHMLLILATGVLFWFMGGKRREIWFYVIAFGAAVLLFCVTVKWQPWISRFHLPLFILAMPFVAAVLERTVIKWVLAGILGILFLAALQPLGWNNTRGLFSQKTMFGQSRQQIYFSKHKGEYPVVTQVAQNLNAMGCREVGVLLGSDSWEYTWQTLLGSETRVEHVRVEGLSAALKYPKGEFIPCAVIELPSQNKDSILTVDGGDYFKVSNINGFALYLDRQRYPGKR